MFAAVLGVREPFSAYFSLSLSVVEPLSNVRVLLCHPLKKTLTSTNSVGQEQYQAWLQSPLHQNSTVEQLCACWLSKRLRSDYDLHHLAFSNVKINLGSVR